MFGFIDYIGGKTGEFSPLSYLEDGEFMNYFR